MISVFSFFSNNNYRDKPWLIIGKGPSYAEIKNLDITDYYSVSLNHVIREQKVDIAHLIDFDVFLACEQEIVNNADFLMMPMYPHFHNKPSRVSLKKLIKQHPVLSQLDKEGRLLWYNHVKYRMPFTPRIDVLYFSSEAVVDILGRNHFKEIYTIGIDGGTQYNSQFEDLKQQTLLSNGRNSFDIQFDQIRRLMMRHNIKVEPVKQEEPIKVYVATQEEQMLAVKVLEYSIQKRTKAPVEVIAMHQCDIVIKEPKDEYNRQRTPFSFQRFLIPQLNHYQGRAIYVDSDMQVLADIKELWNIPMGTHDLLTVIPTKEEKRKLQFSVMLLDCNQLRWDIDRIVEELDTHRLSYSDLMYDMKIAHSIGVEIPSKWNCLEWFRDGESALIHYTDMQTQPWISTENPLCHIWLMDLITAITDGVISLDFVKNQVELGYVRPSLLYQIQNNLLNSVSLPKEIKMMDSDFRAPYKTLHKHTGKNYDTRLNGFVVLLKKIFRTLKSRHVR